MEEAKNNLELEKELFEMVYQWGKAGIITDFICNSFHDKLAELKKATLQAFKEAEIARLDGKIEYKIVKEIWCPKQNVFIKEYWSHHDESLHCQNCGSKVEVREKKSVKNNWEQYEEIQDQITHLKELLTKR